MALLAGTIIVAGCVAPVASNQAASSVTPAATTPASSRTPNPNELARQSRPPSPSVVPTPSVVPMLTLAPGATPSSAPTPAPLTELQLLIPILVNGGGASPQVVRGQDAVGNGDAQAMAFTRMLDSLGATPDEFEGASSSCCSGTLAVFDMRVRGVSPERLADAFVAAAREIDPGMKIATRTVADTSVRRLRYSAGSGRQDVHLAVLRGVVFAFSGPADQQANVDATIAFMRRPPLDQLLPRTIDGQPTQRMSAPASGLLRGGDMSRWSVRARATRWPGTSASPSSRSTLRTPLRRPPVSWSSRSASPVPRARSSSRPGSPRSARASHRSAGRSE
jgi:hypothetical protein